MNSEMNTVTMLLILCMKRYLHSLVDELDDWQEEGARVMLYGVSEKAHDGFMVLRWEKPIPERFRQKLREDEAVIDFFTLENALTFITIQQRPSTGGPHAEQKHG